ncbi:unnamed protein product, partial [Rotaria sordida]
IADSLSCGKIKLLEHIFNKHHTNNPSLIECLCIFCLNDLIHLIESSIIREILFQYNNQTKTPSGYQSNNL